MQVLSFVTRIEVPAIGCLHQLTNCYRLVSKPRFSSITKVQHVRVEDSSNSKTLLVVVSLFAFCLRLSVMFATGTYHVVEDDTNHFGFGWEMGRVACSIAEGRGFASPLPSPTGPTAIVGPVYPVLLSAIFKGFGTYSAGSAIAIRILQSIFSSLTCVFLYLCGRDTMGESTGRLAALVWSVFPLNIFLRDEGLGDFAYGDARSCVVLVHA